MGATHGRRLASFRAVLSAQGVELRRVVQHQCAVDPTTSRIVEMFSADDHTLVWPAAAALQVRTARLSRVVSAPSSLWVPSGVPYTVEASQTWWSAHIRSSSCPSAWSRIVTFQVGDLAGALLTELHRKPDSRWSVPLLSVVVDRLRDAFATSPVPLRFPTDPRAREVADHLVSDPGSRRELADWAPVIGASERTLRRLFSDQTGLTFGKWRSRLRVHSGMRLLAEGLSVGETARRCGYASTNAFARAFSAELGVNPSMYAASVIGTSDERRGDGRSWPSASGDWPRGRDVAPYLARDVVADLSGDGMSARARGSMLFTAAALFFVAACSDDGASDNGGASSGSDAETDAADSAPPTPLDDATAVPDTDASEESIVSETTPPTEPAPTTTVQPETTPPIEPAPTTTVQPETPRFIEHSLGTTEVPARSARIVTASEAVATHLLSVGTIPVGVPDGSIDNWFRPLIEMGALADFDASTVLEVGVGAQLNLEAIASLDPDLILLEFFQADSYDAASQIAPTVMIDRENNAAWRSAFDQTMLAAGVPDSDVEPVTARYEALLDQVPAHAADVEISFVRGAGDAIFLLDVELAFAGSIAAEAGYEVDMGNSPVQESDRGFLGFSNEQLDVIDGDVLVTTAARDGQPSSISPLVESPLWERIPAVQDGNVVEFVQPIYNGGTYVAAEALLAGLIDAADGG